MTGRQRIPVKGEIPNPITPPTGCTFHPRCPHMRDRCRVDDPPLYEVTGARSSACHYYQEVLDA